MVKGYALFNGCNEKSPIAIKTVKKTADIEHFKAILSELKILAYLGPNKYLANLRGAWTENIRNSKLLLVTEVGS